MDQWCDMWDKALQDGFMDKKDAPIEQSNTDSFFGMSNQTDEAGPDEDDVEAWRDIYNGGEFLHGSNDEGLLSEVKDDKATFKTNLDSLVKSPNPVQPQTIGKDQELDSIDSTYTQEDIDELHELKIQLHGLQDKLASMDGKGEKNKKIESQMNALKEKIEDLSNGLGQVLPQQMSSQK